MEKGEMWGRTPAEPALQVADFYAKTHLQKVLIPGFGYGRNAKAFIDKGLDVTGIEISQTAIDMAHDYLGPDILIHHGSVDDMPFDDVQYDGIFSHALVHLFDKEQRLRFYASCYRQLRMGGYMAFSAISPNAPMYGNGVEIGPNRFRTEYGVDLFFYDEESIEEELNPFGLVYYYNFNRSVSAFANHDDGLFWFMICQKR